MILITLTFLAHHFHDNDRWTFFFRFFSLYTHFIILTQVPFFYFHFVLAYNDHTPLIKRKCTKMLIWMEPICGIFLIKMKKRIHTLGVSFQLNNSQAKLFWILYWWSSIDGVFMMFAVFKMHWHRCILL